MRRCGRWRWAEAVAAVLSQAADLGGAGSVAWNKAAAELGAGRCEQAAGLGAEMSAGGVLTAVDDQPDRRPHRKCR